MPFGYYNDPNQKQQISNKTATVKQANQLGQQPNFQPEAPPMEGAAPKTTAGAQVQGSVGAPAPVSGAFYSQQGYAPSSWATATPAGAGSPGGVGENLSGLASNIAYRLAGQANPNVARQKETLKESVNAQRARAMQEAQQSAASRGLSGGVPAEMERNIADAYGGMLTGGYRDIEQGAEQQGFENLLGTGQFVGGLGSNLQGLANQLSLGQGQLSLGGQQLGENARQFDTDFGLRKAQAEQNQNLAFWNMLTGGL